MNRLPPDETLTDDGFLGGRLRILQPKKGFRAGTDSVFVAAAVPAAPGEAVFEAGTGPGAAALCLAARVRGVRVTGVEADVISCMLAERNAERNDLGGALRIIHGDVRQAVRHDQAQWPPQGSFAHAFANPPYFEHGRVTPSPNPILAGASAFGPEDLDAWIHTLAAMVRPRGTVTVIYPASRLDALLAAFSRRLGDIRIAPLRPRAGEAATRVILQGVKGSHAPVRLLAGMALHGRANAYTAAAEKILREGAALPLQ